MSTLSPAPIDSPLTQKDGTASTAWARWFSQLQSLFTRPALPFAAYNSSLGQALSNGVSNVINFATEEEDTDSAVTTGSSWRWTCPSGKGGLYSIQANAGGVCQVNQTFLISLYKNGSEVKRGTRFITPSSGNSYFYAHGAWTVPIASGDYIDIRLYVDSGGMTLEASSATNWVAIACLQMDGS